MTRKYCAIPSAITGIVLVSATKGQAVRTFS
jgi:hypothetical protein